MSGSASCRVHASKHHRRPKQGKRAGRITMWASKSALRAVMKGVKPSTPCANTSSQQLWWCGTLSLSTGPGWHGCHAHRNDFSTGLWTRLRSTLAQKPARRIPPWVFTGSRFHRAPKQEDRSPGLPRKQVLRHCLPSTKPIDSHRSAEALHCAGAPVWYGQIVQITFLWTGKQAAIPLIQNRLRIALGNNRRTITRYCKCFPFWEKKNCQQRGLLVAVYRLGYWASISNIPQKH